MVIIMISNGSHLTSLGMEFQTEEGAMENERSPSLALLSILDDWFECRFLVTEVDGSKPGRQS